MVACSSRVIVAATTEKLGERGNWQIASLDEIDDLVLTTSAPPALAARFPRDPRCVLHPRLRYRVVGHAGALRQVTHGHQRCHAGPGAALPGRRFAAGDAAVRRARRAPGLPSGDGGQHVADLPQRARAGVGRHGLAAGTGVVRVRCRGGGDGLHDERAGGDRRARSPARDDVRLPCLLQHRRVPWCGHHARTAQRTAATVGVGACRRGRHAAGDAVVGVILAPRAHAA
ncbi:hypothetical protein G6F59_013356 [Rhizopus arrhizus]|nr:hypothetical protein G6F59_013356 [Rhizopus arrhizus]